MDINRAIEVLELFRKVFPDMTVNQVLTFLYISRNGSIPQKSLEQELNVSGAAASRNVNFWVDNPMFQGVNVGFVRRIDDYSDRRHKIIALNERGKMLAQAIREA